MREQSARWLTLNYEKDYAPKQPVPRPIQVEAPVAKKRKLASDCFLNDDDEESGDEEIEEVQEVHIASEVEQYLLVPQIPFTMAFDLLEWWHERSVLWPNLSKMARQFLALPATSGGVERLFSAGGAMNGDLRKNIKEETLGIQLYINKNALTF